MLFSACPFRRPSVSRISILSAAALLFASAGASAAPIPPDVEAMVRAASGDDLAAVARVAKSAHPGSAAEIDALVKRLQKEAADARRERLARAGFLDEWSGSGLAGLTRTTGNTNDLGITAGFNVTKDGLHFRHKLNSALDRQTTNGVLTRNKYLVGYEMDYKFNARAYVYGAVAWDKATFAGIDRRYSESAGVGYTLINNDRMRLDVTGGLAFRQTVYSPFAVVPEGDRSTARMTLDYSWKITDGVTLTEKAEYFVGSEIRSVTALNLPVRDALSAQVAFDVTYQDEIPAGREHTDTATRLGLVYSF